MDESRIIVALDGMRPEDIPPMVSALGSRVWGYKVNDALYGSFVYDYFRSINMGPAETRIKLMADPKLYDIPSTMANAVSKLVKTPGVQLITVHASADAEGIRAAIKAADGQAKILAVTVLTSFDETILRGIYGRRRDNLVGLLTKIACDAGADGLVCSSSELDLVKQHPVLKVCPGFRLPEHGKDDQVVTGDGSGADLVVIGRPITKAKDPAEAADRINDHLASLSPA